ncbi:glycosyltransferase family 4 protein [Microbacterium gorillae]|uniref:glycosyltransferase family 4 protein n=1 Tax=Microbacterium gorillae TaxID=1231063 RepID=UPI00059168D2|nr:glycosyltransferase family 4 protein [Microbacterium gorillae]
MHVVFFGDQHLESSGGAQVSTRLQRAFLERAGHTVSVVAPKMPGRVFDDPGYIDTPSIPITLDREYAMSVPGKRVDRFIDAALASRPPVDLVHVQADFWGGITGHRFARRHDLPVVHTMHNRVDVGLRATAGPIAPLALRVLNAWQRRLLPLPADVRAGSDGWAYLRGLAAGSAAVTAPSGHFARRLEEHDVFGHVDAMWNGADDAVLDSVLTEAGPRRPGRPRFVWVGRMSPEKRLLPFLRAVALSGIDADVEVIGGGGQLAAARRLVAGSTPTAHVRFAGRLPYADTLRRLAEADAVVQTSIGFETQGMTPFEAAALGTPAVISDPDIAGELETGFWAVPDESVAALATTLRTAATDIAGGRAVAVNPAVGTRFRQSSRTADMIELYRRLVPSGS